MHVRPKTSYHPHLLVAFYLNCLPPDLLKRIPRSTRYEWLHKDQTVLYGYNWHLQNKHSFDTLREVATSRQLLRINKALLRIIALQRFITRYKVRVTENIFNIHVVVLNTIHKITPVLPLATTILHADSTIFRTADNVRNYIYLVQDNFSRAILSYRVANKCKARFTFENLQAVVQEYLLPSGIASSILLTDDGSENAGPVKNITDPSADPSITHLIAQRDIEFSNSMIEAANKQLKYRFLYHQNIPDQQALVRYVQQAVQDYNNRPHDVLNGLTPLEVLHGRIADPETARQQGLNAKIERIAENKKTTCCSYSF